MRLRIPNAAKVLVVLTAAGLLLGGCYYHPRASYGGPHFAPPGHGYQHHSPGKGKKHGHYRHRHGGRGSW